MEGERITFQLVIAFTGLFVSAASLITSILAFRRDRGMLAVYIGLGDILTISKPDQKVEVLQFKITNIGRRPVTVIGIYGDLKYQQFKRCAQWILSYRTPECLKPKGYFLPQKIITSQLMPEGKYQTLHEGQEISILVDGSIGKELSASISKEAANLYVSDSTGRRHYVTCKVLRKLCFDVHKIGI